MAYTVQEVIVKLHSLASPEAVAGMARFGISTENTLGISMPTLRDLAREIGRDHQLALGLWQTGLHEARILASMVDIPGQVTEEQMESWVKDFDSWDVCDQVCGNLFDRTPLAYRKAVEWSDRFEEFVKRAGFVMMAGLALHDKTATDEAFEVFFPCILEEATDDRNFVKKAVNWALRGIGKRSRPLNERAIETARQIAVIDSKTARWIAADALRELTSEKVQSKLR
jgi:3-methyladenine DNA glycosylase AlkD